MAASGTAMATGSVKLKVVTELVDRLEKDLDEVSMLPAERTQLLDELKVYGRDPMNADAIFTKRGITTLLRHAFFSPSSETARAALRVLANSLLLKPETRQIFVDEGYAPKACDELSTDTWDNEFLLSRIIFLLTYGTDVNLEEMMNKHNLAESIVSNIHRHAKRLSGKAKDTADPMEEMALTESLKLVFNVTHYCPDKASAFTPAFADIVALLWKQDIPSSNPLDPPFGPLVNALLNLDLESDKAQAALFPKDDANKVSDRLIELLDVSMRSYGDNELETIVSPCITLMMHIHKHAPEQEQQHLRTRLLPTAEDRKQVLGRGSTLSARLLKNSTNPVAPSLRDVISRMFFDMSDNDASKFVENIGYGFASGFLFQNNVPIPESAAEAFSTGDVSGQQKPVNPITGQFIDKEKFEDAPEMTQEEKEREAERLFVLFERLKKTGIVDVENPVETAMREGRFRDLGEDEVEELD